MQQLMRLSGPVSHLEIERQDAFRNALRFTLGGRRVVFVASASDATAFVEALPVTVVVDATNARANANLRAVAVRDERAARLYRPAPAKSESYWRNLMWSLGGVALGFLVQVLWTRRALYDWQLVMIALWFALVAANAVVLLRHRNRARELDQCVAVALQ